MTFGKPWMKIEYSYDVVCALLQSATIAAQQRFSDALEEQETPISLNERIHLLKMYGTVRIAIGRQAGHTTAAIHLANNYYESQGHRTIYFGPAPERYREMGAEEAYRWTTAISQDATGVRAIFVDPGPHAGSKAREAIYQFAAEAMRTDDGFKTVVVYFIGS